MTDASRTPTGGPSEEEAAGTGPVIRDKRRIDPETGQRREEMPAERYDRYATYFDPDLFDPDAAAGFDEGPLWHLFSEGRYAEVREAIAEMEQETPGWQASDELLSQLEA